MSAGPPIPPGTGSSSCSTGSFSPTSGETVKRPAGSSRACTGRLSTARRSTWPPRPTSSGCRWSWAATTRPSCCPTPTRATWCSHTEATMLEREHGQTTQPRGTGRPARRGRPPRWAHEGATAMPKVLIITGDAAESLEVMYPYQRLLEEGYQVDIAAPSVKKLQFVVHDFVDGFDTYTEKLGYTWPADVAFADVNPADYAALVIPGGRAPEYIRNDKDVQRIVRHFMGSDLPVAQLCHAPLVLAAAGTLTGRRTAAYPALAPDVGAAGAEYVDSV